MFSIGFSLSKDIVINRPLSEVMKNVGDFSHWNAWSPWIIQEPDCPVTVEGTANTVGHTQAWKGERIGSGQITIAAINENDTGNPSIDYDLVFFEPWKSQSKTQFIFEAISDEETKVTWSMQGTLPFFLFFLKKMMIGVIGSDYARGLLMLKEFIETDEVLSSVAINGIKEHKGFHYVGFRHQCDITEIKEVMGPVFQQLVDERLPIPDLMITISHKFDFITGQCDLTGAFAYHEKPSFDVPTNMVFGEVPDHKGLEVDHTGSYQHLGNGWATAKHYQHFAKLKSAKDVADYEIYRNAPQVVPEKELLTSIILPLKG